MAKNEFKQFIRLAAKISQKIQKLLNHLHLKRWEIAVLVVLIWELAFPQTVLAQIVAEPNYRTDSVLFSGEVLVSPETLAAGPGQLFASSLPSALAKPPKQVIWITVTAYSSTPDQTDDTPCLTANGYDVCANNQENIVAANFLPMGAVIKLPDEFGERLFTVQDRMNARYTYRLDVWLKDRQKARDFGVKHLKVEVY